MARTSLVNTMLSSALVVGLALFVVAEVDVDRSSQKDLSIESIESSKQYFDYPTGCPKEDPKNGTIVLPYLGDCTKYYSCYRGKKIPMDCPEYNAEHDKLYFNPETHICDWPENVECQMLSESPSKQKLSERQASLPTECPKYDSIDVPPVLLPHERDCTKFYMCSHGSRVLKQCPETDDEHHRLYFNFKKQICDWPTNVHCRLPEPKLKTVKVSKKILPVPTECPERDSPAYTVHLAFPGDCTKFYKCLAGVKHEEQCPEMINSKERLHFNKVEQVCDWPWEAGCDWDPPIPPRTTTERPTRRPTTTERPTRRPTTTERPTRRPTTTRPPPTPTPNPGVEGCVGTCPAYEPQNEIVVLPHEDCNKWCSCEEHEEKVWPCPDKLEFSPSLKKCVGPEISECKGRHYPYRSQETHADDETLMNILGYNKRFTW